MFFTNLGDREVQNQIKNLTKGKSGVYKITNLKNNKVYVGSGLTKKPTLNRLYVRFRNHFFNHHKPFPIKRAIQKYGVHNFSWEILEFTEPANTRTCETHWIQSLKPDYNILESAHSSLGYAHTPETLSKIKEGYSQKRRERIGQLNRGKKLSLETRERLAQAALARTPAQRQKHQRACDVFNKTQFSKPIQILNGSSGKILNSYSSFTEACRACGGNYRSFKRAVKSGEKLTKFNIYVKYLS